MHSLSFVVATAKKAGAYLLKHYKDYPYIQRGQAKAISTKHDLASEKIILDALEEKYPSYNILSEERGYTDKGSAYTWIVDPLDGSSNYVNGNPIFAICIALMHENKIELGCVYAPYLKELYTAKRGKGAFMNKLPCKVSPYHNLSSAYLLTCEGGSRDNKVIAKLNHHLHPLVTDMRKLGSAAIEGAWVASGRYEAYLSTKINSWDIAASAILVEEAGGKVSALDGSPWPPEKSQWFLKPHSILFSNGAIHQPILDALATMDIFN